ncbi:MAG: SpoVA/SpoVAEb family sporulation membrane protein [Ruminococcus sp.]|nr:SpoVA/SpoVAEb family sporulation membrane protein [Ruminococcus sp.]
MQLTKEEYSKMYEQQGSKTKWWVTFPKAFIIGGGICVIGQGLNDLYSYLGADSDTASTLATVTLIFISSLLTAFGLYHRIARHAGAGTLVPVTGFANSVAAPAVEFRSEGYITGLGAKIFIISGPVILYGILASVIAGAVMYFMM